MFINNTLCQEYLNRSLEDLSYIEDKLKIFNDKSYKSQLLNSNFEIYKFGKLISNGEKILLIDRPTIPEKIYPNNKSILLIFCTLGLVFSLIYLFLQKAVREFKKN